MSLNIVLDYAIKNGFKIYCFKIYLKEIFRIFFCFELLQICLSAITGKCQCLILSDTKQGTTTGKKSFPQACVLRNGDVLPPTGDLSL